MSKQYASDMSSFGYRFDVSVSVLFSDFPNAFFSSSHWLYILMASVALLEAPAESSSLDGDTALTRSSGIFASRIRKALSSRTFIMDQGVCMAKGRACISRFGFCVVHEIVVNYIS